MKHQTSSMPLLLMTAATLAISLAPSAKAFDPTPYPGGVLPDGSAASPWKINAPGDFDAIGTDGIHFLHQHYQIIQDLDCGNQDHRIRGGFSGSLDGGYHKIARVRVDLPAESFGALVNNMISPGTIRRLAVVDSSFRFRDAAGAVAGAMQWGTLVEECYSQGNTIISVSGNGQGGLVGATSNERPAAVVRNSYGRNNSVSTGFQTVGGICGYNDALIERCYAAGTTLTAPRFAGGVAGYQFAGSIVDSYSHLTNHPALQEGSGYGTWQNALVPDRNTSNFNITFYSIVELGWDPAVWTRDADGYPWLAGFNQPPRADAGEAQTVQLGTAVYLDGSGSSDDRTPLEELAFAWSIEAKPAGSAASLTGADTLNPALVPDQAGTYTVKLTVTDSSGAQGSAETTVTVTAVTTNGGFEDGLTGWSASGNLEVQSGPPYTAVDGSKLVSFNSRNTVPNGVLSQMVPTVPGQAYRIDFTVGVLDYNRNTQRLRVTMLGNTMLVSETIVLTGQGGGMVTWLPKSYQFTADSAGTLLKFEDLSQVTNATDLLLDQVRVTPLVRTLMVASLPENGFPIQADPPDTLGEGAGSTVFRRYHNPGTQVSLSAPIEARGGTFFNWLRDGEHYSIQPDIQVTMDADHLMTAVYWTGAPMITLQPVGLTTVVGGTASFSVTASGASPLSYQWIHNGIEVPGAVDRILTLNPASPADAGTYEVVVTNRLGSVTSSQAVLAVGSVSTGLENGSFESGLDRWNATGNLCIQSSAPYLATDGDQLVAFNCGNTPPNGVISQSFGTTPGQRYILSFDMGALAFNTSRVRLDAAVVGNTNVLSQSLTATGAADGTCRWTTHRFEFTADSNEATLTFRDRSSATTAIDLLLDHVAVTPQVNRTLQVESLATSGPDYSLPVMASPADINGDTEGYTAFSRIYPEGSSVTLSALESYYTSTYPSKGLLYQFHEWRKDGAAVGVSPVIPVVVDGDHTMTAVYVEAPPVILSQPADVVAAPGASAWFHVECVPYGYAAFNSCQWRFNGIPIPGQVTNTLVIDPVGIDDAGTYDVQVFNSSGVSVTSRAASLIVVTTSLVNGSFESAFDGWSHSGNVRVQTGNPAPDGTRILGFNTGDSAPDGRVSQAFFTVPGMNYRLEFDMGVFAYNKSEQRLQIQVTGVGDLVNQVFPINGAGGGKTVWARKSLDFKADSTGATVHFSDVSAVSGAIDLLLDRVKLIPLPIKVTTLIDEDDGMLGLGSGDSLREALTAAAANPGSDTIHFDTTLNGGTITLGGTQLTVDSDVTIDATSLDQGLTVSGNDLSRVFEVKSGRSVSIAGVSMSHGGAWLVSGCGIFNSGTLNLYQLTISGNHTLGDLAIYPKGAGVFNQGVLRMDSCTATGNSVGNGSGGAVYNSGTALLVNCTLAGNLAVNRGGGILNDGTITVRHCTISENQSYYLGGGGICNTANLTIENSIIAGNRTENPGEPDDLLGAATTSLGANLVGGDPVLAALGNHGGRTMTMPPLAGSPAIDAATPLASSPSADQRGVPRPLGPAPDLGAVELKDRSVTTLVDEDDGLNAGNVSLRDAVNAQATDPVDLIRFASNLNGGTIRLTRGAISSSHDLSIDGGTLPAGITISGNDASSVFVFESCVASLAGVTITDSADTAVLTNDCRVELTEVVLQGNFTPYFGAALTVWGPSSRGKIRRSLFQNNAAYCLAGAIESSNELVVEDSSFVGNVGIWGAGAIAGSGWVSITNSTFHGNSSVGNGTALWLGTARIVHSTIVGNPSDSGAEGAIVLLEPPGPDSGLTLLNSIVAGNPEPQILGELHPDSSHNLIGGDPMLSPLGSYGGPTPTMPPIAGSPVLDAAVVLDTTPARDQRGFPRITGPAPDLGAVESQDGFAYLPAASVRIEDDP